jgi:hypothetical protein
MALSDKFGRKLDPNAKSIVVPFNVDKIPKAISIQDYAGIRLALHPVCNSRGRDGVARERDPISAKISRALRRV